MNRLTRAMLICGLFFILTPQVAYNRDLGQWENTDPSLRAWYLSVRRTSDGFPCCGEADAYWCSPPFVEDGKVFCKITDDRPDAPRGRPHVEIGTKIEIPPDKYAFKNGNPTGHPIIFLSQSQSVICFVQESGT